MQLLIDPAGNPADDEIRVFGAELAYADHGEPEKGGGGCELTSASIFAVGTLPIGERFELFAKAGAYQWDIELTGDASGSDDDLEAAYGAGAKFKLGEKIALRLEYELFEVTIDGGIDPDTDIDVDIISFGAEWRF